MHCNRDITAMRDRAGRLLILMVCAVAACSHGADVGRPDLAPIRASIDDVCSGAELSVCDPMDVDVESFRSALEPLGVAVSREMLEGALGRPVRDVPTAAAYRCAAGQPIQDCEVLHARNHLRVEPAPAGADTLKLDAMLIWTGQPAPFSVGFSLVRHVYVRRGGQWVFVETRPRIST